MQGVVVEGDQESGGGGVGVWGDPVGVEGVLGEGDQGVPEAGAVVAGVPELGAGFAGLRRRRCLWCRRVAGRVRGRRAAVRRAPSSAVPRPRIRTPPARSATIDRDRPRWAARSSRRSSAASSAAVEAVGVDDLADQVADPPSILASELGGVQGLGVAQHQLLPPPAGPVPGWEVLDRRHDHVGLLRVSRHRPPAPPGSATTDPSGPWPGPPAACPHRDAGRPGG